MPLLAGIAIFVPLLLYLITMSKDAHKKHSVINDGHDYYGVDQFTKICWHLIATPLDLSGDKGRILLLGYFLLRSKVCIQLGSGCGTVFKAPVLVTLAFWKEHV